MDTPPPPGPPDLRTTTEAIDALGHLTGEIRRELARIRRDIAQESARAHEARLAPLRAANEQLVQATMKAERRAEDAAAELEKVTRSSQFDHLTGTPNRSLLHDRLGEALAMAARHGTPLAVMYLDLDGFKEVNDTAGHAMGDEVLKCVATRLRGAARASDTVSRQGGDEFIVLLPEVADRAAAARIARKMLDAVARPMDLHDRTIGITASIGIAMWPDDGEDDVTLIGKADQAMYDAKRAGRHAFRFAGGPPHDGAARGRGREPGPQDLLLRNLRDVNEQLLLAAVRAQELLDAAELARGRHAQAIAVVAHELRSPLAVIHGSGRLLLAAHGDDPGVRRAGEVIDRQATHMARIIDDLYDSTRAGAGGLRLERAPVALCEVLARSIEASQAARLLRHQRLASRLPSPSVTVDADPLRLEQVFTNLLENASKYTPADGHVALTADEGDRWVSVTVSDDGIGVSAQALPHVFDLFVRERRSPGTEVEGLGVGLAVVRELVEAHGGTVQAHSEGPGRGSRFVVRLPRSLPPAPHRPATTGTAPA